MISTLQRVPEDKADDGSDRRSGDGGIARKTRANSLYTYRHHHLAMRKIHDAHDAEVMLRPSAISIDDADQSPLTTTFR